MKFYALRSIVASRKTPIDIAVPLESFSISSEHVSSFIEPSFRKIDFPKERPSILLVSAVGASGKTTAARQLSYELSIPILDLARHKAVGDNSLTGVLTSAYAPEQIGAVLAGLKDGSQGVIIDGIDEGRSKTSEQAFEAFLDDVANRTAGAPSTTIVMFGRGQVLEDAWYYLTENAGDVAVVVMNPFDLDSGKKYIDAKVQTSGTSHASNYIDARDMLLEKLRGAFATESSPVDAGFTRFLGYPPVLDAVAALLTEEPNYHKVSQSLDQPEGSDVEVALLLRIAEYLMQREREEKALPNFIEEIIAKADSSDAQKLEPTLYTSEEQCARVLALSIGESIDPQMIEDAALNAEYEKAIAAWLPDHPFLADGKLRNPVFEAVALTQCAVSPRLEFRYLAKQYADKNTLTYHFFFLMRYLHSEQNLFSECLNPIIQSASDFLSSDVHVSVEIDGQSWEEECDDPTSADVEIRLTRGSEDEQEFLFSFSVDSDKEIVLGPTLLSTHMTAPCPVRLWSKGQLDFVGESVFDVRSITFDATDLVLRGARPVTGKSIEHPSDYGLYIVASCVTGYVQEVVTRDGSIAILANEHGLHFPLAKYFSALEESQVAGDLEEPYFRLRRILMEFASHSKGQLAKYRAKIEHERVMRNDTGKMVLAQLLEEGILTRDPKFYFVDGDKFADVLGVSWQDLRQHKTSEKLIEFLGRAI